jgi:hypothetical protein
MNCKQAKTQLALLIGNDLEPAALQEVRNHVSQCVGCRQHFEQLSSALEVLQAPPRSWNPEHESLWPKLSARLASPTAGQKPHRLSGWAPSLAVAAACVAMFWVVSSQWPGESAPLSNGIQIQAQPIGGPPSFDRENLPNRNGFESRTRRSPHGSSATDPSGGESDIIELQRQSRSAIPVVPVAEPSR